MKKIITIQLNDIPLEDNVIATFYGANNKLVKTKRNKNKFFDLIAEGVNSNEINKAEHFHTENGIDSFTFKSKGLINPQTIRVMGPKTGILVTDKEKLDALVERTEFIKLKATNEKLSKVFKTGVKLVIGATMLVGAGKLGLYALEQNAIKDTFNDLNHSPYFVSEQNSQAKYDLDDSIEVQNARAKWQNDPTSLTIPEMKLILDDYYTDIPKQR